MIFRQSMGLSGLANSAGVRYFSVLSLRILFKDMSAWLWCDLLWIAMPSPLVKSPCLRPAHRVKSIAVSLPSCHFLPRVSPSVSVIIAYPVTGRNHPHFCIFLQKRHGKAPPSADGGARFMAPIRVHHTRACWTG